MGVVRVMTVVFCEWIECRQCDLGIVPTDLMRMTKLGGATCGSVPCANGLNAEGATPMWRRWLQPSSAMGAVRVRTDVVFEWIQCRRCDLDIVPIDVLVIGNGRAATRACGDWASYDVCLLRMD